MNNEEYNKLDNEDEEKIEITDEVKQYEMDDEITDIVVDDEDDDESEEDYGLTRGDKIAFIILILIMIAGIVANEFFILKN